MPCFHCEKAFEGVVMGPGLSEFADVPLALERLGDAAGSAAQRSLMCGRCGGVFFPLGPGGEKRVGSFDGSARIEGHDALAGILWALQRMAQLRRNGEPARFRVSWVDHGGVRTYRLDIRRVTGSIERPSWFKPREDEDAVEETS